MIEKLCSRIHFAVFGPDLSYDDGFPAVTDEAAYRFHVSGGKTLAAFHVALPASGIFDDPTRYETHFRRYFADGRLDRTFGRQGVLNVGGTSQVFVVPGSRIIVRPEDSAAIRSYTLNGRVDSTFGGGDGATIFPTNASTHRYLYNVRIAAVLEDGSILTQAQVQLRDRNRYLNTITLVNPDGSFNADFGSGGSIAYQTGYADLSAMMTDDSLYLLNDYIGSTEPPTADIIRLSRDGRTADFNFGGDGRVRITGFVDNLTVQSDGKLLYLDGKHSDEHVLYRINTDGSPDTSFSGDGKATIAYSGSDAGLPVASSGQRILIDNQNRIVVSGDNSIFRFSPSGTLDAYPFNGSAPFPTALASIDEAGGVVGTDGKRYALVSPQQLGKDGYVKITTGNGDDTITISDAANFRVRVVVNGESRLFRARDVKGFVVQSFDGDLDFHSRLGFPVTLTGGNGDAVVTLGNGNDNIQLGTGDHTMDLGGGNDTVRIGDTPSFDATTDPNATDHQIVTGFSGDKTIEILNGSAAIDLNTGDHEISGYREVHDFVINIGGGNNRVWLSGQGGDRINIGGRGRNDITIFGPDTQVTTGLGPDKVLAISPYGLISTTGGNDVVTIRNFTTNPSRGVTVLAGSGNDNVFCDDGYQSLATVYGGPGDDLLEGNVLTQRFYGENGNDTLDGGDGNDFLYGGDMDDLLIGGSSSDRLYGESGNDRLHGQGGNDFLYGGDGNDLLYARNDRDELHGESGNDRLYVNNASGLFYLYGGDGDDRFYSRNGRIETLYGNEGDDVADADADDLLDSIRRA